MSTQVTRAAGSSRTPRSGGRTAAAQRRTGFRAGRTYPTQGSAALTPVDEQPRTGPRLEVTPPPPVAVPRAPFAALVLVVVVGGVLGILLLNTKINENAFRLGDLHDQQQALDQREQELGEEIARVSSTNELAAAARRLGLVEAGEPAYLRLPDGTVVGVPVPATGEPSRTSQGG